MDGFLHIGYPKCFSTTLQRNLFAVHDEIHYGGIGIESNIDFHSSELNLLFESGLIYYRRHFFESRLDQFTRAIADFIDAAPEKKRIFGFSSEHLLFNFTPQTIDIPEKLRRMRLLFGDKVKLIVLFREPLSLLLSLYKEYVNMGYRHPLGNFFRWVYRFQDRSFYRELFYADVLMQIRDCFSSEQLKIGFFEDFKQPGGAANVAHLYRQVSEFLAISPPASPNTGNRNPSLSNAEVVRRMTANRQFRYDFGEEVLGGIENHRRRVFFTEELNLDLTEPELFENVFKKRRARKLANEIEVGESYNWATVDEDLLNRMLADFHADRRRLENDHGFAIGENFSRAEDAAISQITVKK